MSGPRLHLLILFMAAQFLQVGRAQPPAQADGKISSGASPVEGQAAPKQNKVRARLLTLSGSYVDHPQATPVDPSAIVLGRGAPPQKSFYRMVEYLDELSHDDTIQAIVFDLSDTSLTMNSAQLDEFTRRMAKLKKRNKKTIAWLEVASNVHVALAASCDHILLADMGVIEMPSASMQTLFYKDAMDLLGVQASVVRAGDFKGAVEPYLNSQMSDHLREHYRDLIKSMNSATVARIAQGRGISSDAVRALQAKQLLQATEARECGLVDELVPFGSLRESVAKHLEQEVEWVESKGTPRKELSLFDVFGKLMAAPPQGNSQVKEPSIAVLHLSGTIVDGKRPAGGAIVSGPTVASIQELANDANVKAVVVRINSPGGSATASEAIRQSLIELAKKKPTMVSMGAVAASGGYWVSCIGEPIYAEHGTMTGSIGVFTLKLSIGSLMRRLGVHVESIVLDESADSGALYRGWSGEESLRLQSFVDTTYAKFLDVVTGHRKLSLDEVQPLAGGRVWSGEQALKHGLVDALGGVDDCVSILAKRVGLNDYKVIHRPNRPAGLDLLQLLGQSEEEEIMSRSDLTQPLTWLRLKGLDLGTTQWLIRESLASDKSVPTVWALNPAALLVE